MRKNMKKKNRKSKMNSFQKNKIQKQKMHSLNTDEEKNEEPILEILETQELSSEEADERLFAIIKRDYPNVQANSKMQLQQKSL